MGNRRAKIIGTVGPASSSVDMLKKLITVGLDVVRINMGHGTHASHAKIIGNVRKASSDLGCEVGILMDLQGPKIRVGKLPGALKLEEGEEWFVGTQEHGDEYPRKFIPTTYENLVGDCRDGVRILFDDGLIVARSVERMGSVYRIKIETGGVLESNKGINMPDCHVSASSMTKKDREDLMFGLKQGVDFFALSFVKNRKDVDEIKYFLHKLKKNNPIIAKIETLSALEHLDGILDVADIIMVARGDLGVELGNHRVPGIQKSVIETCNRRQKPVITATQMMESMRENATPTRAEASDIANAIWDGSDALMLSAEMASGKYPLESVSMMGSIIEEAERKPKERPLLRNIDLSSINTSVMVAASMVAEKVGAKKILAVTESGHSCQKISIFRPQTDVVGITVSHETARRMTLYWGITPYCLEDCEGEMVGFSVVLEKVKQELGLENGDKLVLTGGDGKLFTRGTSNSIKVEIVKERRPSSHGGDFLEEADDGKKRILLDTSICAGCQNCVKICPHDIWAITDDQHNKTYINRSKITDCTLDMECIRVCPTGAIEIIPSS